MTRRAATRPTCSRRRRTISRSTAPEYRVKGSPDRKKTIQEIAFALDLAFDAPEGMEPYLDETAYHDTPNCTWPFGTHIATVEIDEETGVVDLVRYVAVDDVGNEINPLIVAGQLHGGIAQGVGQALWEGAVYSDDGQLLTGSMLDYALPKAARLPNFELDKTVTPSPVNPLGVKGVGEAGAIASTAAVANAVIDALERLRHPPPRHAVYVADGLVGDPVGEGRPGMIPAAFDYQRGDLARRCARSALAGGDAKVIAGGMSLLPLMKLRLAQPAKLVDIGNLSELRGDGATADGGWEIGALTTYSEALAATELDFTRDCVEGIGDIQVRNRGTVGGAISHADPASDLPALLLALDYSAVLRSSRGERTVPLDGFFKGAFETDIAPDEILVKLVRGPLPSGAGRVVPEDGAPGVGLLDRRGLRGRGVLGWIDLACAGRDDRRRRGRLSCEGRRVGADGVGRVGGRGARPRPDMRPTGRTSTATSTPTGPIDRGWPRCTSGAPSTPPSAGSTGSPSVGRCASSGSLRVDARPPGSRGRS